MHEAVQDAIPRHWWPQSFKSDAKSVLPVDVQTFWSAASAQAAEASRKFWLGGVSPEHDSNSGVQCSSTHDLHELPWASVMQSNMQWSLVQPVRLPKQAAHVAV